ncbi:MAG TPA: dual specificity protein phosphatase family protein [Planococcus sp. (in: firmicutes)]|nr:dual specificity protein phosphatase family protein [Planococcus sp. (in: firmicutes)]
MAKSYNELIKGKIFIGGAADARQAAETEGTAKVFDLRSEAIDADEDYLRIHTPIMDDREHQDESIKNAIDEVVGAYRKGEKVFFHCAAGSNRAGTVAIGTLLELGEARTYEEAEQKAKRVRPIIQVKPEYKEALKRLYPEA